MLVTFEGIDFTGKTTLIQKVAAKLPKAIVTKEPGSQLIPINSQIREMVLHNKTLTPLQRELLFYVDALGHKTFIENVLAPDALILSDRGTWSHYAFLSGYMRLGLLGSDPDENYTRYGLCKKLIKQVCAEPDVVIYLEGDLKLMEERSRGEKDQIEQLGPEFFSYVLTAYDDLCIAREIEQKPLLILDARAPQEVNTTKVLDYLGNLSIGQ